MSVRDLLANPLLGLQRADALRGKAKKAVARWPGLPALQPGGIHEWFFLSPGCEKKSQWHPPMTVLGALAVREGARGTVAWIGRSCWPTLKLLHDLHGGDSPASLENIGKRCLFIDPRSDKERFWVIEEALRCAGLQTVVADGSNMTPTISRRLQLAAEAGSVTGLIARRPDETQDPSWATTRWHVRPVVSGEKGPRWEIAADKRAWDAQQQWTVEYEVRDGTGALHLLADVGRGLSPAERDERSKTA